MSPVLSPQVLADICQHHKPIGSGKALELAVCARDVSSAGAAAGVAGALAELPSWGLCTVWAMLGSASCRQHAALLVTPVKGKLTRKSCPVLVFSFVCNLVAAVAVWRSRRRVWLAAGLGLLQTHFCNSLCRSWSIAEGCLLQLSAREIRVPACQQKVTFRMAWKSIFHMLGEMLLPASHNDLYLARTCKIVSLADCQKLHHIGVNCF